MSRLSRLLRKPLVICGLAVFAAALVFAAFWFQPWKLWVDKTVNEAPPKAGTAPSTAPPDSGRSPSPASPRPLASGKLISHEHRTSGEVRIVELADGSRVLRLEDLDTSNGPDLRVWLTDAPVKEGRDGWHVFDDGAHVSLGKLKGNKGSQNYTIPQDVDLSEYTSVTIWCDRFNVSFGAAELKRV